MLCICTGIHSPRNHGNKESFKTLILRAHIVCSNQYLLETEIKHLENGFAKVNGYPT